jgi:hypothetical protein
LRKLRSSNYINGALTLRDGAKFLSGCRAPETSLAPIPVAINISAVELRSNNFVAHVRDILKKAGLEPQYPEFELPETARSESSVASCKAVGNVKAPLIGDEAINATLQNQALGLGGNTIFVTEANGRSVAGVAYSCP